MKPKTKEVLAVSTGIFISLTFVAVIIVLASHFFHIANVVNGN